METKEKNKEELSELVDDKGQGNKPIIAVGAVVDKAKDVAEKGAEIVGDAAKVAVDFAGDQLKNAKSTLERVNQELSESRSKRNLEKYRPIFPEDLEKGSVVLPSIINVVDSDKRMKIKECEGAVGYNETINGTDLVGVYLNDIDKYNISFNDEGTTSIYYVHPFDEHRYIEISEYFSFLKEARISELKYIAQSLGAKHFKVSIMEEKMTEQIKKVKGGAKLGLGKDKGTVDAEKDNSEKNYEFVGVASESWYTGKPPVEPKLEFWANSEAIRTLVKQRMAEDSRLLSETYKLDYNISTGIKEKEAAKIDGVLKALKFNGAGSISEEVKKESHKKFEYTIEF